MKKIEVVKVCCRDCARAVPYTKGFLNANGEPVLCECLADSSKMYLLNNKIECKNYQKR